MSRLRLSTPLALLAALALALAACTATTTDSPRVTAEAPEATPSPSDGATPGASASDGEPAEQVTVQMDGSDFIPAELTIAAGTEVIFVNVSEFEHNVTEGRGGRAVEDPFVDVDVAEGDSADVTFDEVGTFDITCRIHPTMDLTVTVEG